MYVARENQLISIDSDGKEKLAGKFNGGSYKERHNVVKNLNLLQESKRTTQPEEIFRSEQFNLDNARYKSRKLA